MSEREGIIFFRSWREAIKELPEEKRLDAFEAIIDYALYGAEPETGGIVHAIFLMAKPTIDRNEKAYQDGKRGGRPPGSKKKQGFEAEKTMVSEQQKPPFFRQETTETGTATATGTEFEEEKPKPAALSPKVSARTIFNACLMTYPISKELQVAMEAWLKYKTERRESYKEQSLRVLMKKAYQSEKEYGTSAVIEVIEESMANRYQGITWDRLRGRAGPKSAQVKKNSFTDFELQQDYDFEAIERESLNHE